MIDPYIGERVFVRPSEHSRKSKLRVQWDANFPGRIMGDEWEERLWSEWLHRRWMTGEVEFRRPEVPIILPIEAKKAE